jgi:malonyl-CoA decarboxylase
MRGSRALSGFLSGFLDQGPAARPAPDGRSIVDQCRSLMAARGESSTLRQAASVLATYRTLSPEARTGFFEFLADELDIDPAELRACVDAYAETPGPETLEAVHVAAEPARQDLFRMLNQADGATAHLVAMRRDLFALMRDNPDFGRIDLDFAHLFNSWFNRGFLMLHRINWNTPATILEKIIAYEAVHQINDWDDLRRRTQPPDRRCYGYFHPRMPEDPLIFVEVALTTGVPVSVQDVLAEQRTPIAAEQADTAVFYSISNCQAGLKGVSFGNSLIKHVVSDLSAELPRLKTFITLSPIPGLRRWLDEQGAGVGTGEAAVAPAPETLRHLAAAYLATARRADGLPLDPVARFHLSNGARIENVLAGADLAPNGLRQSHGVMVNYRYDTRHVEARSERFAADASISLSRQVQALARAGQNILASGQASGK